MWLWTKQAPFCQSDNSKKFVLSLHIKKGEMNLVLPVVRHFVRLHGNPKMLLVSKKVPQKILFYLFPFNVTRLNCGQFCRNKKEVQWWKIRHKGNWQLRENGMQDCGIQGDQHSLKLFAGESSSVASCYERFSAGKVLVVSICFLSVFYILWEPFISGFSIWHQGNYLQLYIYTSRYPRALHGAGSRKYNMSYDCTWKEKISTIRLVKLVIYEFLLANGDWGLSWQCGLPDWVWLWKAIRYREKKTSRTWNCVGRQKGICLRWITIHMYDKPDMDSC